LVDKTKVAYIDTSVLANWMLYRKKVRVRFRAEKRARQSMKLLKLIQHHKYSCKFITSTFAFAEIGQSARDARTAVKIIRDGLNPSWFNRLKRWYPLKPKERTDIMRSIQSFYNYLEELGVEVKSSIIDPNEVNEISLRHSLEVCDATHVVIARSEKADYLITVDPDFAEVRPKIRKPEAMNPDTLYTKRFLRINKH